MAPFAEETASVQWHGELLRAHFEWTLLQELARRLGKTVGATLARDRLTLLWNDHVGRGTLLRGALDLLSRRFLNKAIADEGRCTLKPTVRAAAACRCGVAAHRFSRSRVLALSLSPPPPRRSTPT